MQQIVQFFAWLTMVSLFAPYVLAFLLYLAGGESFFGLKISSIFSIGTAVFFSNIFIFLILEKRLKKSAPAEQGTDIAHPINRLRRLKGLFSKPAPNVLAPSLAPGEAQLFPDELYQSIPRDLHTAGYYTGIPGIRTEIGENIGRVFFWIPLVIPFVFYLGSGVLNWFFLSLPIALEAIYFPMLIAGIVSYKKHGARFKHGGRYIAQIRKMESGSSKEYRKLEAEADMQGKIQAFHAEINVERYPLPDEFGPGSAVGLFYLPGQTGADIYIGPKQRLDAKPGSIPVAAPAAEKPESEAPRWLTTFGFIWFFGALLGPPIGWGLTGGLPGIYESGTWQKWFLARLIVGGLFPLFISLIFCAGSMFYRPMRIAGVSFVLLSLLPMWSIKNTWLDLHSGPQTTQQVITAFKEDEDIRAKWQAEISTYRGMPEGGYIARFADGKTADFHCEPICLSEPKEPDKRRHKLDRYRTLLNKKCQVTQFAGLNEIVDIQCPEP